MPYHGEIVEPNERFITYAHTLNIADEVFLEAPLRVLEAHFIHQAKERARQAAKEIDCYAPIVITTGPIRVLPKPNPWSVEWSVHVRVEFWHYVYDDTWRLEEEWQKEQIRRTRRSSPVNPST